MTLLFCLLIFLIIQSSFLSSCEVIHIVSKPNTIKRIWEAMGCRWRWEGWFLPGLFQKGWCNEVCPLFIFFQILDFWGGPFTICFSVASSSFFIAEPPVLAQVFLDWNLEPLGSVWCLAHVTCHIHREMVRGVFLRSAFWLCLHRGREILIMPFNYHLLSSQV